MYAQRRPWINMTSSSFSFQGCRAWGRPPASSHGSFATAVHVPKTRSMALRQACEQNRCNGDRRDRAKHS